MTKILENNWARLAFLAIGIAGCASASSDAPPVGPTEGPEGEVADTVRAFYDRFNDHSFEGAEEFAAEDWNLITPNGDWWRGQEQTIRKLNAAHDTFLSEVSQELDDLSVSFAASDVAVVTATSHEFSWTGAGNRLRSSFVLTAGEGRWWLRQTHHTFIVEDGSAVRGSSIDDLSDVGGEAMSHDARLAAVHETLAQFETLSVTHAFDDATDLATEDLSQIAPTGYWARGREASIEGQREVATTFLDGVKSTPRERVVRFLTDDVALVTETAVLGRFTSEAGVVVDDLELVGSSVLVNHGGVWLLRYSQATIVNGTL